MRRALILLSSLVILGCGGTGTGGGNNPAPAPSYSGGVFEGAWAGSLHSKTGQTMTAYALVLASGEFRYVANNWVQASGNMTATGTTLGNASFTASGTMCGPSGFTFPGGASTTTVQMTGAFSGLSIIGTYSGGGDSGTFTFAADPNVAYHSPVNLATTAGTFRSVYSSSGATETAVLTSSGAFSGSDIYGNFTGTLSAVDPALNAYHVSITYTLNGGMGTSSYTGLAYFENLLNPIRLYIQASGPNGEFAGQFTRTGP